LSIKSDFGKHWITVTDTVHKDQRMFMLHRLDESL